MATNQGKVQDNVFWAWDAQRTAQHRIRGVTKVSTYQIDAQRWSTEFSSLLSFPSSSTPTPAPPTATTPRLPNLGPYSRATARTEALRAAAAEAENLAAAAAAHTQSVLDQVLSKTRPRYALRASGKCLWCGTRAAQDSASCNRTCYDSFLSATPDVERTHAVELRETTGMGYGAFTRPGGGGLAAGTHLALYVGTVLPFCAPEVDDAARNGYLFELHEGGSDKGKARNQVLVDSRTHGNWTRFLNSHCRPNCRVTPVCVGGCTYLRYETIRAVGEGEELTIAYGPEYWGVQCRCDAQAGPHAPPPINEAVEEGEGLVLPEGSGRRSPEDPGYGDDVLFPGLVQWKKEGKKEEDDTEMTGNEDAVLFPGLLRWNKDEDAEMS